MHTVISHKGVINWHTVNDTKVIDTIDLEIKINADDFTLDYSRDEVIQMLTDRFRKHLEDTLTY